MQLNINVVDALKVVQTAADKMQIDFPNTKPKWASKLGKYELLAFQASSRGGVLECVVAGDRVLVSGQAVQYMTGFIRV